MGKNFRKNVGGYKENFEMRIIVTGGAGFVGSHLVELLIKKNHFPIIIDNLSSGKYSYIKKFVDSKKAEFLKMDIRNYKKLKILPKVDAILHLAAVASVVESITNPKYVNDVNITGTLNVLELCKEMKIPKLIFTSSAAVYGDYEKNISEKTITIPTTVYGSTKLTGEQYCKIYSELYSIKIVVLRPFNIYGPRQNDAYAGVIHKFFDRIEQNKRPIIFGNGKQTRDFIYVKDIAMIFEKAVNYNNLKKFEVFNLGTGKSVTINHLLKLCLKTKHKNLKPIFKKAIPGVVFHSTVNIKKLKNNLKFIPKIKLEQGLERMILE
jgi:UDP-glucose 4-epimerase